MEACFRKYPVLDSEFLSESRKDQLSLYHEQWRPLGLRALMQVGWKNRLGIYVLTFGRAGPLARFRRREMELLGRCLPQIRLAEALMSHTVESSFECWAQGVGLSRREREIAELVARGLRNREIASVLGVSPFTVRNELVLAFRKAEVTTRAELVNAMRWHGTHEGPAVPRRMGPKGVMDRPWMRFFRAGGTKAAQGSTSDARGAEGGGSATSMARQVLAPPGRES